MSAGEEIAVNRDEIFKKDTFYKLFNDKGFTIVGCGGVGSWLAYMLAKMGARKLILIDGDEVEFSNLPRTVYRYRDVGRNKAEALEEIISELLPDIDIIAIPEYFNATIHLPLVKGTILFIATDDTRTKIEVASMGWSFIAVNQDGNLAVMSLQRYWMNRWNGGEDKKTEYTRDTGVLLSAGAVINALLYYLKDEWEFGNGAIVFDLIPFSLDDGIADELDRPIPADARMIYTLKGEEVKHDSE